MSRYEDREAVEMHKAFRAVLFIAGALLGLAIVLALGGCASSPEGGIEEVEAAGSVGPFLTGKVKMKNPNRVTLNAEVPEGDTYMFVIGRDKPAPNFNIGVEDPRAKYSPPPPPATIPSPQQ